MAGLEGNAWKARYRTVGPKREMLVYSLFH
jgi:hypothetical protein